MRRTRSYAICYRNRVGIVAAGVGNSSRPRAPPTHTCPSEVLVTGIVILVNWLCRTVFRGKYAASSEVTQKVVLEFLSLRATCEALFNGLMRMRYCRCRQSCLHFGKILVKIQVGRNLKHWHEARTVGQSGSSQVNPHSTIYWNRIEP